MNINSLGQEVAVVLGSGIAPDGTPARTTILRARAAARLAKARPHVSLILSGDGRKQVGIISEAQAMQKILLDEGISAERIFLEGESQDTVGNAVLAAALFFERIQESDNRPVKIFVVTSPFHAKRALIAFRALAQPHWQVVSYCGRVASTDGERGRNESGGVQWMADFFADIKPGDIGAAVARLLERRPYYRTLSWLSAKRSAAKVSA